VTGQPVLDVTFRRAARFPGVLYLDPDPAGPLRGLTVTVAEEWPQAPPYAGAFASVVPHLTVAQSADERALDEAERDIRGELPITASLTEGAPVRLRRRALAVAGADAAALVS
jgi:hypothetical protein